MSRHDDDGGNETTSGEGDQERVENDAVRDEFSDWLDEAADADAHAADEGGKSGGWIGRMFGRESDETEPDGPDGPALGSDPDELSIFSAVQLEDDDADDSEESDESEGAVDLYEGDEVDDWYPADDEDDLEVEADEEDDLEVEADEEDDHETDQPRTDTFDEPRESDFDRSDDSDEVGLGTQGSEVPEAGLGTPGSEVAEAGLGTPGSEAQGPEDGDAEIVEIPQAEGPDSDATFVDLWDDDGGDDDIIDFASFTSEDYVQATTSEYAGLAEAVARAEEEETQRIAVSAEIPGLESGIVGLEDMVGNGGDDAGDLVEPPSSSDLPMRVLTAVGLIVLFAASLLSPFGIGALIVVVLGIAAGEMYSALIRAGYRPLSLFGFAGIGGAFFGTWAAGPVAIPISLLLGAIAVFLFYATVPGRRAALENATLTLLVMAWIGACGGLAFDIINAEQYQWLVLALVLTVAAMDIAQYFVGRRIGKRQLAPQVSPKKTVEGYIAGVIVAVAVGAAFGLAEPFDVTDGLLIGGVVAIIAPLGDLAVSVLKRALGVKDMGYILPGHGGVLDRVDAMIMTIPALWLAYSWMGLII